MIKIYCRPYFHVTFSEKEKKMSSQVKRVVRAEAITELMLEKRKIQSDNNELNKLAQNLLEEYTNKIRAISNQLDINLQKEAALDDAIDKILMGININETV